VTKTPEFGGSQKLPNFGQKQISCDFRAFDTWQPNSFYTTSMKFSKN